VSRVAAWAAGLGLMTLRRPAWRGMQLGQRPDEMVASVAGHGRKPVGEDVAPSASWARDADRFPQFPQREAVQVGQAGEVGGDGFLLGRRDGDRQPGKHHQPVCLRTARPPGPGGRDAVSARWAA
jgi:hypothetical protein